LKGDEKVNREKTEGLDSRSWKGETSLALAEGLWRFLESLLDSRVRITLLKSQDRH